ncbi:cytokine receptor isoform X3 [Homalodisca vitripennis]|uniref:cytokine receptor isoform X3 n=1 Tax=Homalodisca vitripennis TaxID=197043 RepID=UPI001EECB08A|nr:cytokine receptor isoform X3 [Homalodisca vitripennis]
MESSPCNITSSRKTWLVMVCLMGLGAVNAEIDNKFRCGPGITTPGVTIPSGDIILEYGSPLEIFCVLSPGVVSQGFNSSQLVFYHTSNRILPEFVTLVNESTARLYVEKPVPMEDMFYCKLTNGTEEFPVCLNSVAVGFSPQEVLNFSCVSHNWDNLNCTWTPPLNYVKTKYTLVYYLPGRNGWKLRYRCPNETDVKGKNYCFWDQSTTIPYRQPYEYYYFLMTGENRFGSITTKTKFHHYAYVLPTKAANLTYLDITSSSVMIQWSVVFPMQNFPPGVLQKVEYQSQWDLRNQWHVVDVSSLSKKSATHQLNITGLQYANSLYDFRVFMRSPMALGEHMWSEPATLTIKTRPTVPGAAPETDIGSFEVTTVGLTNRDVYVYWRRIPEYLYNGDFGDFYYKITVNEDGVPRNLQANETTSAYARFTGLSLNSYRFKIVSANKEGISKDYSEVYVPSQSKSLAEPLSFTKIAFDNHIYELSWKPPATNRAISSYTIFWCDNNKDRPYQCTGTLNWTRVSSDVTIKNITVPDDKIYQFAISANTKTESSGMVWASCTVIHNKILGKMKNIWINRIGSTFIEVDWKLECSDRIGVVTGFLISYCPIVSPHNPECKVEAKNTTIKGDGNTMRGNVTNLTPYTIYMVMVAVMTKTSIGQWSDRLYNTTLEAAPDVAPLDVKVSNITNTSMVVQWTAPHSMNGVLRYYQVHYNGRLRKVEAMEGSHQAPTQVQLDNLDSFVLYNVSVSACTVACSIPSHPLQVHTAVGKPGKMERPGVNFVNSSQVEVTWQPPRYVAGHLDSYQVKIEVMEDQHNNTDILSCTGNQTQIPIEDCNSGGPHHKYSFSVRAVNYANDTAYYGPWSDAGEGNCYSAGTGDLWFIIWAVICLICVSCVFIVAFLGKRLWERYEQMRTVEVKLPPGLAPVIEKASDPDYYSQLNLYGWGSVQPEEIKGISPPDQELLLQKKGVEREAKDHDHTSVGEGEGDGDSSGCSSGHESVTSSLTAGTHISSDSGTEADQLHDKRATSLDGVFSDSASPPTSLRQRNKAPSTSSESSTRWERGEPYVMLGGSSSCLVKSTPNLGEVEGGMTGYSLLGGVAGGVWRPPVSASGYVSLPPAVPAPAPPMYVAHPPCWAEKEQAVTTPSKGYVMAGESDPPSQYVRLGHSNYVPHRQLDADL